MFGLLISRTVRTAVLQERDLDYVAAARLRDESALHIMFVEMLPNVMGPILVEFTVRLGYAIFTVATLSFLGFGVRPPTPDWGADIAASYQYLGRRVLVGDAIPGAGYRLAGDRDQPDRRLHRGGDHPMTTTSRHGRRRHATCRGRLAHVT